MFDSPLLQGFPSTNYNVNSDTGNLHVNARTSAHTELIKQIANAAAVLLKNTNNALPLSATSPPAKLAIIGQDAANQTSCGLNACDDGTLSVGYATVSPAQFAFCPFWTLRAMLIIRRN